MDDPQRQDDPDKLWEMIDELNRKLSKIQKYKDFYEMLKDLFAPEPTGKSEQSAKESHSE